MSWDEIRDFKDYFTSRYSNLRREQQTDELYYKDMFSVPQIVEPVTLQRTGTASRLIDSPAEHIITSNPQAFRANIKGTKGEEEASTRISAMLNKVWVYTIKHGNPDLFKEFVKKLLLRGDAYIKILHNESWVTGNKEKEGLPVNFFVPDSMTVYAEPEDETNGVPNRVLVVYNRSPNVIKAKYPNWTDPRNSGAKTKEWVEWIEYWTPKTREFYADEEAVLESTENVYGFVPFIHKLSGFGSTSPDGKLEDLIMGRLRFSRDRIQRECAITSSLDWIIHNFANRSLDVQPELPDVTIPDDIEENYRIGTGLMHKLPFGLKVTPAVSELPKGEEYAYLATVKAEIEREDPLVMAGFAMGQSGRQQDMTQIAALRRYDTVVENTECAFGQAFGMALRIIESIPGFPLPDGLKQGDIGGNYNITVKLKAADPLMDERKATLGSRMLSQGEIDPITNLVDYKGFTEDKAYETMVDILKWKVLLSDPNIAAIIGQGAVEQAGMGAALRALQIRQQELQGRGVLGEVPSPTVQNRMAGETKTPGGFDMIDMALSNKGIRMPPEAYDRDGIDET